MPLNRDQRNPRTQTQAGTDRLTNDSLGAAVQERHTYPSETRSSSRNQNKDRNVRQMLEHNDSEHNVNLVRSGRNFESLKIPVPLQQGSFSNNEQARSLSTKSGQKSWQSKESRHVPISAFDDTESFNHSELDQDDTEEVTAVLRSDSTVQHGQQVLAVTGPVSTASRLQMSKSITQNVPSQQRSLVDLDVLHYDKEFEGQVENDAAVFHEDMNAQDDDEFDIEMDTPSRPQAVSRPHILHGPKKKVDFVDDAEMFGGSISSPFTRSAELVRELSPNLQSRQASRVKDFGVIPSRNTTIQNEKPQHNGPINTSTRSGPASSRFAKIHEHKLHVMEQTNKVSAPDSDVQESSDDDGTEVLSRNKHDTDMSVLAVRKRAYDWNSASEYTMEEIRGKKLQDLQSEPFLKSPKVQAKHLVSEDDHETLPAKLQKLQDYTDDEQRVIFRAQNDDEWTQVGKWFVERLEEDLEKLMAVRLERRKIALRYEDQLRRRQKEIEWVQGGVENELKELESGGGELIRNRKTPSRAGTPMKLS